MFSLIAQEQPKGSLKVETGLLWDAVDGKAYLSGPFLNIEPKLKISKNTFMGMRVGAALNTQRIVTPESSQSFINNEVGRNGVISIGPTLDYFFNTTKLRPYIGLGFQHSFLTTSKKGFVIWNPLEILDLAIDDKIGFLIRGGIALDKVIVGRLNFSNYILGLEFNYIPIANVKASNGQKIGTVATSNVALSIGRTFGGFK